MSVVLRSAERVAVRLIVAALLLAPSGLSLSAQSASPELPRAFVNTTYAPPSGPTITVPAGGNLQTAINNATLGSTIMLEAGATYGAITLPNKSGSGWIYIMSNGALPPPGYRVTPANAGQLARIQVSTSQAIGTATGAHHYRLIGLEVSVTGTLQAALVNLSGSPEPHHIIIDRCYIHGTSNGTHRRGVQMHGSDLAVIDSYVSDFKEGGADSQAIVSWNGSGPLKIQNNYLSASGENVMFGGADPTSGTIGPSDIEVRGNHFFKPLSWRGSSWVVKNLLEFKNARRVLVEGNVLENNWAAAQNGMAILITPRNQDGGCTGCGTQDITIRRNILLNGQQGINVMGDDNNFPSTRTNRVLVEHNQFTVSGSGGEGKGLQLIRGPVNVVFNHNTWTQVGTFAFSENSPKSTGFVFTNNVIPDGAYGFIGTSSSSVSSTLSMHYVSPVMTADAIVGASSSNYPTGNWFPSSVSSATMNGNDGSRVGADQAALAAATSCAVSGQCGGEPPPPPTGDTSAPTVAVATPAPAATVAGQVVVAASASDNVGVVGVQFQVNGADLGAEVSGGNYSASWTTTSGFPNGKYNITAIARDAAGNKKTSAPVDVTVNNAAADTTLPTVSVMSPAAGATLAGQVIVSASASDNVGVVGVQFRINGANFGPEVGGGNSAISWTTTSGFPNGSYTITAIARDAAGNTKTSATVNVMVNNPPPPPVPVDGVCGPWSAWTAWTAINATTEARERSRVETAPPQNGGKPCSPLNETETRSITLPPSGAPAISNVYASGMTNTFAIVNWTTSQPATSQVEYGTTAAYGSATPFHSGLPTVHDTPLSGLLAGTTYHYRVRSQNSAGQLAVSGDFTFTTTGTAPSVWTISGVTASRINSSTYAISWLTSVGSTSQVEFGKTTAYGNQTAINAQLITAHSVTLSGLKPGSTYHFRVISKDASGVTKVSGDFTFTARRRE